MYNQLSKVTVSTGEDPIVTCIIILFCLIALLLTMIILLENKVNKLKNIIKKLEEKNN